MDKNGILTITELAPSAPLVSVPGKEAYLPEIGFR